MKVLLDTSVQSDKLLPKISDYLADRVIEGDVFYISVVTHFEILWGYHLARLPPKNYEGFLNDLNIQVVPLLKSDVEAAASLKPSKKDILDALIASCVLRLDAKLITFNEDDFKKFLKPRQILVPEFGAGKEDSDSS